MTSHNHIYPALYPTSDDESQSTPWRKRSRSRGWCARRRERGGRSAAPGGGERPRGGSQARAEEEAIVGVPPVVRRPARCLRRGVRQGRAATLASIQFVANLVYIYATLLAGCFLQELQLQDMYTDDGLLALQKYGCLNC
jgi:hypothetical protein